MKVLLVNGSPHKDGCTYTALCEVSEALNEQESIPISSGSERNHCQAVLPASLA